MIAKEDSWDVFAKVLLDHSRGDTASAKSVWKTLCQEFRVATMRFVRDAAMEVSSVASCPSVTFASPFGCFRLSPVSIRLMCEVVPCLVQ